MTIMENNSHIYIIDDITGLEITGNLDIKIYTNYDDDIDYLKESFEKEYYYVKLEPESMSYYNNIDEKRYITKNFFSKKFKLTTLGERLFYANKLFGKYNLEDKEFNFLYKNEQKRKKQKLLNFSMPNF